MLAQFEYGKQGILLNEGLVYWEFFFFVLGMHLITIEVSFQYLKDIDLNGFFSGRQKSIGCISITQRNALSLPGIKKPVGENKPLNTEFADLYVLATDYNSIVKMTNPVKISNFLHYENYPQYSNYL